MIMIIIISPPIFVGKNIELNLGYQTLKIDLRSFHKQLSWPNKIQTTIFRSHFRQFLFVKDTFFFLFGMFFYARCASKFDLSLKIIFGWKNHYMDKLSKEYECFYCLFTIFQNLKTKIEFSRKFQN